MENYKDRIRAAIASREDLTASGLSRAIGANKNYVSDILSGKINPTHAKLLLIAKGLGITPAELIFGINHSAEDEELMKLLPTLEKGNLELVLNLVRTLSSKEAKKESESN